MLFLLNDAVLEIDARALVTPADARRFERLDVDYVLRLGRELYAEEPLLHRTAPQRARRLAWLIAERAPGVNAALFTPQGRFCAPEQVEARWCALPDATLQALRARAEAGALDARAADEAVWRRLAA